MSPGRRDATKREIARQLEVKEAFGGKRKRGPSTEGLEPKRRKRVRADGRLESNEEADAWAKEQPWFARVVHKDFDMRWWIWWCRPEPDRCDEPACAKCKPEASGA